MKVAALDLGSNTFILTIASKNHLRDFELLCDEVRYVRLGQGVDKIKSFNPEALDRAKKALTEFREIIDVHKPTKILAAATSAARDVSNGKGLIELCESLEIPIEIITGEREAELTFLGARFFQRLNEDHWVIDIGGGSTEIILGNAEGILWRHSFDLGCVRLFERWGSQPDKISEQINEQFRKVIPRRFLFTTKHCLAVAGTPIEIVRLLEKKSFSIERCEGFLLSPTQIAVANDILAENRPEELIKIYSTPQGRADVLFVGGLLLQAFMDVVRIETYTVSRAGIRYGVLQRLWS